MQLVSLILICWIVIYPVDSAIQRLNNRGQEFNFFLNLTTVGTLFGVQMAIKGGKIWLYYASVSLSLSG